MINDPTASMFLLVSVCPWGWGDVDLGGEKYKPPYPVVIYK